MFEKTKSRKRKVSSASRSASVEKAPNLVSTQPDLRVKFYSRVSNAMCKMTSVIKSDVLCMCVWVLYIAGWTSTGSNTSPRP